MVRPSKPQALQVTTSSSAGFVGALGSLPQLGHGWFLATDFAPSEGFRDPTNNASFQANLYRHYGDTRADCGNIEARLLSWLPTSLERS